MNEHPHFSRKRIEEAAKVSDVIERAKVARPVDQGRDVLELTDKMRLPDTL